MSESFEVFETSSSWRSRSDLSSKYLESMNDADAATFFQQLLGEVGAADDTGGVQPHVEPSLNWSHRIGPARNLLGTC